MKESLERTATHILLLLAKIRATPDVPDEVDGETLRKITELSVNDINDAFWLLKNSGYVDSVQYLETRDYNFTKVWITPLGRYEAERITGPLSDPIKLPVTGRMSAEEHRISLPPAPIGSPFGFTDEDWEFIARQKSNEEQLVVVMGYQFRSECYDTNLLQRNVKSMFQDAVDRYNATAGALQTALSFRSLAAGYGEHLFNEIARDIIASDIAVFDTSDLNPNVMLELGVALTWGIRVLPIRLHSKPPPPSDISGQTWAQYTDNAAAFLDADHPDKLVRMVERAVRKKGRHR
ncbi:hypothetical protein [Steroidobacter cummioxidans]|uniref:hypothetical protein n=1 Tax=Steroidobacter cummioxidans TaxID=1803913 RepID=UPI000E30BBFC|nr:hypothetical protein [Steroidobacter cummioxidans]